MKKCSSQSLFWDRSTTVRLFVLTVKVTVNVLYSGALRTWTSYLACNCNMCWCIPGQQAHGGANKDTTYESYIGNEFKSRITIFQMVVFHMNVNVYESEQLQPSNVASPLYIPWHWDYKLHRYDDSKVQRMGTVAQLNASPPDQVRSDVAAIINKIVTTSYYNAWSHCFVVRLFVHYIWKSAPLQRIDSKRSRLRWAWAMFLGHLCSTTCPAAEERETIFFCAGQDAILSCVVRSLNSFWSALRMWPHILLASAYDNTNQLKFYTPQKLDPGSVP